MDGFFPPTTLAIDGGLIGQLVFVLIALLAWILREAAERKSAAREREAADEEGAPRPPSALERLAGFLGDPAEAGEADAVAKRVSERARARREAHPEEYVEQTADAPPAPPPLEPARPRRLVELHEPDPGGRPDVWATGAASGARVRRVNARRRLGLEGGRVRTSVRRAVLWAEVLGPPRAKARGRARGVPPAARR